MGDRDLSPSEITQRVKKRKDKIGEFPVLIRADFAVKHEAVAKVMNAVTEGGIWKISFTAVGEDKTNSRKRLQRLLRGGR
jgi:biopolymer transport protein ExbD